MPRILVIDSDELFRQYLAALLRREGYRTHAPSNGAEMRSALAAGQYDAVVTELYMPDIDGIEVVRVVKSRFPTVAVVGVIGGSLGPADPSQKAMLALGAAAVLTKPIDPDSLLAVLHRALGSVTARSSCESK
jgi:two-component system chemotaxis response regulator CheY